MNLKTFMITLLCLPSIALAANDSKATARTSLLLGSESQKDYSLGLDYDLTKETSVSLDYFYTKTSTTDQTFSFSSDHDLNDTQSINGSLIYSKDDSELKGIGFDLGTDYTISDHWESERSTDLSAEIGVIHYSKEEQVSTTTEKTSYEKVKMGLELEQEINDYIALFIGYKQYLYSDHSEILTSSGKKKTSATSFSSTDSSIKNKKTAGGRLFFDNGLSLSYRYSLSQYKDSLNEQEHDFNVRYKFKRVSLGFVYQYLKQENSKVEHWFGPKLSVKF